MIYFDKSKNLLEEDKYHYELQDVKEPELFRDLYPYDEIPKVVFNYRNVPMDMPAEIWITDTTFRDGQQSTSPFTVRQIVDIFKLMSRLGGPKGIVRQSEFFLYSEKDRRALKECQNLGLQFPEITTWIRANEKDRTGKGRGRCRNGHFGELLRLPHLQKDESYPRAGDG